MKIKIFSLLSFFCIGSCFTVYSQDVDYRYEFSSLRLLESPSVNSYAEEINPIYNRNFDTLFFVRSHHNENVGRDKINQDIWYCSLKSDSWSEPINFKELNNSENNSIVGIGTKAETLYLLNSYTASAVRNRGIVKTKKVGNTWSMPMTIDLEVNTENNFYSFFINHDENVILITMFNGISEGEEDLFVSLKTEEGDRWRDPIYMGYEVNSAGYETSPFLADDGKTMFFTSNGFGGFGDGDIFMSKRLDDSWSNWSVPQNLGKNVNSEKFDGYFSLYSNGEFLLSSNRDSKFSDIFKGKWELIEVPKPSKVEPLPLPVEKPLTKESLPKNIEIYFDFNSVNFDKDNNSESIKAVSDYLVKNPKVGLVVEGQTDPIGDDTFNLVLSLKRAQAVTDYIRSFNSSLPKDRIMIIPSGESKSNASHDESRKVLIKYIILEN